MSTKILFIPGVGADPNFWRPMAWCLSRPRGDIHLTLPGLGDQPHDPAVQSFDDLIRHAQRHVGPREGPVDIVAQSMGGAVALQLALRRPAYVRRLVLVATSGGLDVTALGGQDWRPDYARNFPRAANWVREASLDYSADLSCVTQPILLLWGDADPISPLAVGERLQSLLPNAQLHVIAGGTHSMALNRANEIAPLIRAHFEA